jgi:hypothetical protein
MGQLLGTETAIPAFFPGTGRSTTPHAALVRHATTVLYCTVNNVPLVRHFADVLCLIGCGPAGVMPVCIMGVSEPVGLPKIRIED